MWKPDTVVLGETMYMFVRNEHPCSNVCSMAQDKISVRASYATALGAFQRSPRRVPERRVLLTAACTTRFSMLLCRTCSVHMCVRIDIVSKKKQYLVRRQYRQLSTPKCCRPYHYRAYVVYATPFSSYVQVLDPRLWCLPFSSTPRTLLS